MNVRYVLLLSAVALLLFGLGFLFAPVWTMGLFAISIGTGGVLMTRLLAATFLGFGLLNWFGRTYMTVHEVRSVLVANFCMNTVGFVVALAYRLSGLGNVWGWLPTGLYLAFAVGFGYCLFVRRTYEETIVQAGHAQ